MIIGVPGSGKTEFVVRFLIIAKKLKLKVLLLNYNN
jgi:adenylate kinase